MTKVKEVVESVEVETAKDAVEVKAKRVRTIKPKVTKTVGEIIAEITKLESEVSELDAATQGLDPNSVAYPIVFKAFADKDAELKKALDTVYTV